MSRYLRSRLSGSRVWYRLKTPTGVVSTIAFVLVGMIFCKLGLWQLSRADEKTSIVQAHQAATQLPPLTSLVVDAEKALYRRVELTGALDSNRLFLLDNRIVAGQAGFEVIAPFMLADDNMVLVNLGWIGHNGDRQINLADRDIPDTQITLKGVVVTPSKGFVLADSVTDTGKTQWPFTLQFIDYETIGVKLDKIPVMDAVIIAEDGQFGSFTYNYKPVASGASKHLGYAFQWFAMLIALIVLYLYLMVFKQTDE